MWVVTQRQITMAKGLAYTVKKKFAQQLSVLRGGIRMPWVETGGEK